MTGVEAELSDVDGDFIFSSGDRYLKATGRQHHIATPASDAKDGTGAFQSEIVKAFDAAKRSGQKNPLVIGAIPFDVTQPSCLYVPSHYEWCATDDSSSKAALEPNDLIVERSVPDEAGFKNAVRQAIANFAFSNVNKAVLSVVRELTFASSINVNHLLKNILAQNKIGYRFKIPMFDGGSLIGVSPELLIAKSGERFISNPLAGSAKRDKSNPERDDAIARKLSQSTKDNYEHRLVIDDIRSILKPLSAELDIPEQPSVISTQALWHLSTRIEGRLNDASMNALQLAGVLHPTPAVCGFPTAGARRLINFVEPFDRGLFTGIVGWMDSEGNGEWVVTIRCGTVHNNVVRLFAGAGIVAASEPESEWAEVQTKLGTMLQACGVRA